MHLLVFILDAIVLRLFSELGVGGGGRGGGGEGEEDTMSRSVSGATTTKMHEHHRDASLTPPGSIPS